MSAYQSRPVQRLKELLADVLSDEEELLATWDTNGGRPRVWLSLPGASARFATELDHEYFVLVASNGYWGRDWATLDDEESQTRAFQDLVHSAAQYLRGIFGWRLGTDSCGPPLL